MAYKNFSIQSAAAFGRSSAKETSWADLIQATPFQKLPDSASFAASLAADVDRSYEALAEFYIKDIDTDFEYHVFFDNKKSLWQVEFKTMPKDQNVDLLPNEKLDILRSDVMKKAIARAYDIVLRADSLIKSQVMQHVENGELLAVDETKLEAVMFFIADKNAMANFKARKYAK